jgi:hypothetical protein
MTKEEPMTRQTWVVYKTERRDFPNWEKRLFVPRGSLTNILLEYWTDNPTDLPQMGDKIDNGEEIDWYVINIQQFCSFETQNRIVVAYCSPDRDTDPKNRGEEVWIVYKAESALESDRQLMPQGTPSDILWENWTCETQPIFPQPGDRTRDYDNPNDPGQRGITHGKDGNWTVTRIERFASFETEQRIVVAYCQYDPLEPNWQELRRVPPEVTEKLLTEVRLGESVPY